MKKSNLFLVILMALIVMSCSKDETTMGTAQEGNAIEFGTYVGRDAQTRATITNLAALQATDVGFGVFAHYTAQDAYANPSTSKPNFMYNQQVKFAGTKWGYTPVKYWPNNVDDKVSFFAYGPYGNANIAVLPVATAAAGDPTLKFTVNDVVKSQADLVWGVKTDDGLPFLDQTKQTIGGNIKFTFKHALARIGFNVEAMVDLVNGQATGDDDSNTGNGTTDGATKIVVTQVQLIGKFYNSGVLNLNSTVTGTSPNIVSVPNWGTYLPETLVDRTFTLNANTTNANSNFKTSTAVTPGVSASIFGQNVTNSLAQLNADDSYLMVIPQNFASTEKIKIKVTYDVLTEDTSLDTGQSKVTNVIESTPFNFNFDHGKAYTFNLHLGMTSVKFDATVSDWGTETGTVVNVPINTTTP